MTNFDAHTRLSDLHRTMNVHTKPPSVTGDDEGAWLGAWPSGRMVGKKGDILKLVIIIIYELVAGYDDCISLFPGYAAFMHGGW